MTGTPQHEPGAAARTVPASDRPDDEIREALEQDEDQATRTIARERKDARDAQDQTETAQDSERKEAQDLADARRDGERRDALEQNVAVHQQASQLAQANRTLEAFAYSVSHDLRAPLRVINGYSAALVEEYGPLLAAPGRLYAERIQAASEQMEELIAAILRLARLSGAEIHLQPVDLGAEAAAIAAELQASEPYRHVCFTIHQPVWALADRVLIRTVLQNLLGNAWKFTSGQHSASVEVGTEPSRDTRLCCYVRDNGAGFEPDQAGKLFIPFQRLHTAKQFAGTGVGLASVRRIIERHGGQVRAIGAIGEGATFFFTLAAANAAT